MPIAAFTTDGKTITHSDLSSRSCGTLSGMSRISFNTVAASPRRSVSFFSCATAVATGTSIAIKTRRSCRMITSASLLECVIDLKRRAFHYRSDSSASQFPPPCEQLLDDRDGFLSEPRLESLDRRQRLTTHRDDLGRAQLQAGIERDVPEIASRAEVAEGYLTIRRLPAGDPPIEPVLGSVGGGRDEHGRSDRQDVVLQPSELPGAADDANSRRGSRA